MMLSRITIENFRSIEQCEFHPTAMCALVGENNSGKSNILEALRLVLGRQWLYPQNFSDSDFWKYDTNRDILIELEFDPPLKYQNYAAADPVDIPVLRWTVTHYKRATSSASAGDRRLDQQCLRSDGQAVLVLSKAPKRGEQHQYKPLTNIPREVKDQVPLIFIGTDRSLASQAPGARYSLLKSLLEDVDIALAAAQVEIKKEEGHAVVSAKEVFESRLASAMEVLRIPEFEKLEEELRVKALENLGLDVKTDSESFAFKFGLLDSMSFLKALKLIVREGDLEMEAGQLGEGAQNALVVAIFQAYETLKKKGAIFLIEEPEMYLHPHRKRFFYKTLRSVSTNNQIIYATHSSEFVTIPEFEDVKIVKRASNGSTKVTASSLTATVPLREKLRKELDPERNELFFAQHVLLVEGDTEKLAFPEYAMRLGIDLDRIGCSIVEVGGKRNLKGVADVVASFGIPCTIVFDTDSSDFDSNQAEEEETYNVGLRSLQSETVRVVELNPKYESVLRHDLGETEYRRLCESYPGFSKAVRHRLIAADESAPVPDCVKEILDPLTR